jgi:hypothetical protein
MPEKDSVQQNSRDINGPFISVFRSVRTQAGGNRETAQIPLPPFPKGGIRTDVYLARCFGVSIKESGLKFKHPSPFLLLPIFQSSHLFWLAVFL